MNPLRFLRLLVAQQVERAVKEALAPLPYYLRKLGAGLVLLVIGAVTASLALCSLALALFLALAPLPYMSAALWVALVFGLLSGLFLALGASALRPPR